MGSHCPARPEVTRLPVSAASDLGIANRNESRFSKAIFFFFLFFGSVKPADSRSRQVGEPFPRSAADAVSPAKKQASRGAHAEDLNISSLS